MFKKIKNKVVEIHDPEVKYIYLEHMRSLGYSYQGSRTGAYLKLPLVFIPFKDMRTGELMVITEKKEDFIKDKELSSSFKIVPFYKLIKKSFVKKVISERNERNSYQYDSKRLFKSLKNRKGSNLIQSAIDKNAHLITCLNYTIDFLYGKDNESYLDSHKHLFISKGLKIMKKS